MPIAPPCATPLQVVGIARNWCWQSLKVSICAQNVEALLDSISDAAEALERSNENGKVSVNLYLDCCPLQKDGSIVLLIPILVTSAEAVRDHHTYLIVQCFFLAARWTPAGMRQRRCLSYKRRQNALQLHSEGWLKATRLHPAAQQTSRPFLRTLKLRTLSSTCLLLSWADA